MQNFEIELRFEVLDKSQLEQFVAPFKRVGSKRDIDVYFDNKQAELYQKGIFIRTRNDKKLEIKFNRACLDNPTLAIQDYCEEYGFMLPLQVADLPKLNALLVSLNLQSVQLATLDNLLAANNFSPYYTVDKIRTTYTHASFTIGVDEVANLGTFLEIELIANSVENLETIKQEMQILLHGLSLEPLKTGYGTLLLRRRNFQEYLLGRFILEEDSGHKKC